MAQLENAAPRARRRARGPRWVEDGDACAWGGSTRSESAAGPGRRLFAAWPAPPWGTPARSRARMAAMGRVRRPRARHWATGATCAACARAASAGGVRASVLPHDGRAVATQERGLHYLVRLVQLRLLGQQQARAARVGVRHARRGAVHGRRARERGAVRRGSAVRRGEEKIWRLKPSSSCCYAVVTVRAVHISV